MDITCPACASRYTTDDQKLRGKTARMRCRACDTEWLVAGPTAEEKSPSESKRAAIVKRGAKREHRDLFASQPLDLGSVKQTLRAPPPDSQPGGTAARNETSVLFTVDALAGNARLHTPAPSPTSGACRVDDNEGVIDLNALASSPPTVGTRSVGPLFSSEPPPAAFAADVSGSAASGAGGTIALPGGIQLSKRAIAGIAAAAVALVLCSVGLSAAFTGEEPVARRAATMIEAPQIAAAAPMPVPARAAAPAPAEASASEDEAQSPTVGVVGGRTKSGHRAKGGAKASFSATKVQSGGVSASGGAKTFPKATDRCACKGDFNCILRCTATGK